LTIYRTDIHIRAIGNVLPQQEKWEEGKKWSIRKTVKEELT